MSDLHIDDFYRDSARILLQLYRHFPRRAMIYTEDINGADCPDDFGLPSDRHQACFSAMLWLADNGYLEYGSTVALEALDQAVLSKSGFTLLAAIESKPEYLGHSNPGKAEPQTRSQLLRYKLKHESSIKLADYMRYLLAL
ncbi:MAG: hypothetical protein OIF35_01520 [Cellvibrionaceae bacterium]|nr:hypothetical protein [Cellvibrionaceae bacterium]MCV6627200.1 hypothetical protein [Cellvibrionaceae bacterium]